MEEVERGRDLRIRANTVESVHLLQCAGLAELGHTQVDAAYAANAREERQAVGVAVEDGDHGGGSFGGQHLVEDRGVAVT